MSARPDHLASDAALRPFSFARTAAWIIGQVLLVLGGAALALPWWLP